MTDFNILNDWFENKKDFWKMFDDYGDDAVRFSLVRSLDNDSLVEILSLNNIDIPSKDLYMKTIYDSSLSNCQIVDFILSKKPAILNERNKNESTLMSIVEELDVYNCGIRNDKVDDIIKPFVRNKGYTGIDDLNHSLDDDLMPKIRDYIMWSYFNQLSNDLIENGFYSHPNVIPTLRKIHDIDFFLMIDGKIVPFDLKITHVADDFFNKYSETLQLNDGDDLYVSLGYENEIKEVKGAYNLFKKKYNLPNIGQQNKMELLEVLQNLNDAEASTFVNHFYSSRKTSLEMLHQDVKPLEWWNYKYQGERLFSNNNRFFIFLAHENDLRDGKDLKKNVELIREQINAKLDVISSSDLHTIKYKYEKDIHYNGNYIVDCMSILITGD